MKFRILSLVALLGLALSSCDVDQTREGELPEVDVDVETEAGQLPAYDVDWADVDVTTTTKTVEMPSVRVVMVEEEVEVPVLDVDWPEDYGDAEERTLVVEADVDQDAELDIEEVYAVNNRMIVIAELEKEGEMLEDGEMMRVSDQVIVNAPDDLDVRYYIIGDRPTGMTNTRYKYITSKNDLRDQMQNGRTIYTKS